MTGIRVDRDGAVGIITLDRRERFNAMDVAMAQDFRKAGLQMARDEAIRCVLLKGAGGVFCSGADLKYIRAGGDGADLAYLQDGRAMPEGYGEIFKQILEYLHSTISEIKRAPKPFVAAVDGVAAAGGFGIAMACDLVYASERASFEWAYGKTGLTGAESSTFFLPRLLGLRRAMELVLTNPRLDAATAREWGLVNGVFPTVRFDEEVLAIARRVAAGPSEALAIAKSLVNQAAGVDRLDWHLDRELEHLAKIADGEDFAEGLASFFDKRPAVFEGKG
jgi:2-(1,2-epoxy-1,2-dihydrophenyl)acetyl-CoA isomerase